MKRTIAIVSMCFAIAGAHAQSAELKIKDSTIIADMIDPVTTATAEGEEPAWGEVGNAITAKYDATSADRAVTRAKIYYYYGKNFPLFATAIVHFTVTYEDKENYKLMNKNANYVLPNSNEKAELETARGWVKHALDMDPSNVDYKKTVDDLNDKINSLH